MGIWFTDAVIAFVKETLSNIENTEKENAEIEEKLRYYADKLNQCNLAAENLSEEFRKGMYVKVDPDKDVQKPVLLDEAIEILSKKVGELKEHLELGKQKEDVYSNLLAEITKAYPGVLDEING